MCTATLQNELNQSVMGLSDENVRLLIQMAKTMTSDRSSVQGSSQQKPGAVNRSIVGSLPGEVVLAEDFFETPECFKEYV